MTLEERKKQVKESLWSELSRYDTGEHNAIINDYDLSHPSLNIKKMVNEYHAGLKYGPWFGCIHGLQCHRNDGKHVKYSRNYATTMLKCDCTILIYDCTKQLKG